MALVTGTLPKGHQGRKPKQLDQELYDALVEYFKTTPVDPETGQPTTAGPDTTFDTKGKASSDGRRYAVAMAEKDQLEVKCSVYAPSGDDEKGPWAWRVYVPKSKQQAPAEDKKK